MIINLPLSFLISLYAYQHTSLHSYLILCLWLYLTLCLWPYLTLCLSPYLTLCLSPYLTLCLSPYLILCLSPYLTLCLSICRCRRLGSYNSLAGSMSMGDCRRPRLQRLQSGLMRPQKSGPEIGQEERELMLMICIDDAYIMWSKKMSYSANSI